jgi:hypothetical protein
MERGPQGTSRRFASKLLVGLILAAVAAIVVIRNSSHGTVARPADTGPNVARPADADTDTGRKPAYEPRRPVDTGGFSYFLAHLPPWKPDASLEEISKICSRLGYRDIEEIDRSLSELGKSDAQRFTLQVTKAILFNYEGEPNRAYEVLEQLRPWVENRETLERENRYTLIYLQGVTALRRGETDNCIMCRGESSCILPIAPSAVYTNPLGSHLAIRHFTEYLERFPDDLGVRWLLNLAHMTLGEHPQKVDPRYLISLDRLLKSEFDIGKFRDIGQLAGVNRFNLAGGAVMEDFDNDGRLDLAVTTFDPSEHMAFYRNAGDGTFQERTEKAGLAGQLGGKNLQQTDYNNDGHLDLFISRGAWFPHPIRQSLLRNNGDGTFSDVTQQAGFTDSLRSTYSAWADYDNDGWLDAYLISEDQPNRLYRNRGDGTFEEIAAKAGVQGDGKGYCKGSNWIDFDNDDYPDLFVDYLRGDAHLYRNNRDGSFSDVTTSMGIDGPRYGFGCWAWDYDNDGWLDIFATCYDHSLEDVVKGLIGQPHERQSNRLFRNLEGRGFKDKTKEAGLDMVFETMGSNFGDFDNDGFLDMYLGTGDPDLGTLVPNRMFKNVAGKRFAEITASSGTGHLQKGHGVSCADWDRDGDIDVFIEMGGALNGDKYHNILFQNPGQGNHWLTVKLIGKKTNRAAIGARIKVVTAGEQPLTLHRLVSAGSSWGANPLQQTIGLAKAKGVARLEIHWPTSGTTQVFRDIAPNQAIEVTEFADDFRRLDWKPITTPK